MFILHAVSQPSASQNGITFTIVSLLISLIGYALSAIALWPVFRKAGLQGWGALIPIVNIYLLVKIAGYHGVLTVLYYIPIVNVVVGIVVAVACGRAFGKSAAFSVFLLWLLFPLGYFIIGYGQSKFVGDLNEKATQTA
jgi:hypothetical protein